MFRDSFKSLLSGCTPKRQIFSNHAFGRWPEITYTPGDQFLQSVECMAETSLPLPACAADTQNDHTFFSNLHNATRQGPLNQVWQSPWTIGAAHTSNKLSWVDRQCENENRIT